MLSVLASAAYSYSETKNVEAHKKSHSRLNYGRRCLAENEFKKENQQILSQLGYGPYDIDKFKTIIRNSKLFHWFQV